MENIVGRNRTIMKDDILDAAERVVLSLGASGLSIDAVAKEAGVSKSTVLYDHKSKSLLLEALIDRRLQREIERLNKFVAEASDTPHPELFGRIMSAQIFDDTDRAIAMAISASVSSEENLQQQMRDWIQRDLKAMMDGPRPKAALMAYLVLSGFYSTQLFGSHQWTQAEQAKIVEGARAVYLSYPEND